MGRTKKPVAVPRPSQLMPSPSSTTTTASSNQDTKLKSDAAAILTCWKDLGGAEDVLKSGGGTDVTKWKGLTIAQSSNTLRIMQVSCAKSEAGELRECQHQLLLTPPSLIADELVMPATERKRAGYVLPSNGPQVPQHRHQQADGHHPGVHRRDIVVGVPVRKRQLADKGGSVGVRIRPQQSVPPEAA